MKRHRFSAAGLAMGLVLLGLAAAFLADATAAWHLGARHAAQLVAGGLAVAAVTAIAARAIGGGGGTTSGPGTGKGGPG